MLPILHYKIVPTIELLMPMSEAHSTLRQSLLPHLIDAVSYNVARKNTNVKLYEIGRVFFGNGEKVSYQMK